MSAPTVADDAPAAAPSAEYEHDDDGALRVVLAGAWKLGAPRPDPGSLARQLQIHSATRVTFDARGVGSWDTSLLAWLRAAIADARDAEIDRAGLPHGVRALLELSERAASAPPRAPSPPAPLVARVGVRAARIRAGAVDALDFFGRVVQGLVRFVTFRAQSRAADLWKLIQSVGADALPIVTLISVIVGLILAFVGAVQLRLFGADIYVANLVGVAMVREMGAMMAGIIMAGRTGAAYAAQLGTMRVTGEIDALTTFGISAIDFLVVPRVVALGVMMPVLCLYAIVVGCMGGAIVGVGMLDISPQLYLAQTLESLELADLNGGLFRGSVYGMIIGVVGCFRGMRSGNDAAAVGLATTSAVVTSIVGIIVADGMIAVLFNALGV